MLPKPHGNGSGQISIHQQDMGGWVRIFTDKPATVMDDLAGYLSHALTEWFRQRPQFRLRSVVGVVKDGSTCELHAWYDMHLFPDLSANRPQQT